MFEIDYVLLKFLQNKTEPVPYADLVNAVAPWFESNFVLTSHRLDDLDQNNLVLSNPTSPLVEKSFSISKSGINALSEEEKRRREEERALDANRIAREAVNISQQQLDETKKQAKQAKREANIATAIAILALLWNVAEFLIERVL